MIVVPSSDFGEVHPLVGEAVSVGAWVAGGALRSVIDGTGLHDIDLFFANKTIADACEQHFIERGADVVFRCNAGELITLRLDGIKIQYCLMQFYPSTEALLDSFDFQCTRFVMDRAGVTYPEEAKESATAKLLTLHRLTYPAATLYRMQKYLKYGYALPVETAQRFVALLVDHPEIAANNRVYVD